MHKKVLKLLLLLLILISGGGLVGCANFQENSQEGPAPFQQPKPMSATQKEKFEQIDVGKVLDSKKELKEYRAVTYQDDVVVALELVHWYTFQSKKLASDFKKDLEKEWKDKKFEVTTDHKIFIELEKLQNKISDADLSKKQLEKELYKIKKLSKEQT